MGKRLCELKGDEWIRTIRRYEQKMEARVKAVVLAAGKGTRMHSESSDVPKVMRVVRGKPLLWHVLEALSFIEKKDIVIVVGYMKDTVINYFGAYGYALQAEQLGTGHAVMAARAELESFDGEILVCCGDMPAIKRDTYESFVSAHFEQKNDCTILTGESSIALPYGRVLRDEMGNFLEIVEDRDCTPEQLLIKELNSGVYMFNSGKLFEALHSLRNNNSQGEYYLTDVPWIMRDSGAQIGLHKRDLGDEIIGVNTPEQLAQVDEILSSRE